MDRLFAYGTLQHPRVIRYVIGRLPDSRPALLDDYARYTVRGADYPGIIASNGARIDGTVFLGITPPEWDALDRYEDDLYDRLTVTPQLVEGDSCTAWAYVVAPEHRHALSDELWELNHYQPNHLPGRD